MARRRNPGRGIRTPVAGRGLAGWLLAAFLLATPGVAAAQAAPLRVAFVDLEMIQAQYLLPNVQGPRAELEQQVIALQAEFDERSVGLSDDAKQALFEEYQRRVDQHAQALHRFQQELEARLRDAIAAAAADQGFDVVLARGAVLYGGTDLTEVVLRRLGVQTRPAGGG